MKKSGVVASGHGAKARVFSGKKVKTSGGLKKSDLKVNKNGKVVSKASSDRAKKMFEKNGIKEWCMAVKKARKELGLTGFVAIKGRTAQGKALYAQAKAIMG